MKRQFLQLILIVATFSGSSEAQMVEVKIDLGQPKILNTRTVSFEGKTNLPPDTRIEIRYDPAGRPLPSIEEIRITPMQHISVAADGTFQFTLKDEHDFKTGKYRVAVQVRVLSYGVLGAMSKPQSPAFYTMAGETGENLQGALVHRKIDLLSGRVCVNATEEHELTDDKTDEVARKEKRLLTQYSRATDQAYAMHLRMRAQGIYDRWVDKEDLRSNRVVVDYGLRVKKSQELIRSIRTQEAYFLLMDTVKALDQVHYWSLHTKLPQPAKYANAVTDYEAAKAKLDAFVAGIQ